MPNCGPDPLPEGHPRSSKNFGAEHLRRERAWLEDEVAAAAALTDADRVRILKDLCRTVEAIRRTKTPEELRRDDEVKEILDAPGRARYRELIARLA